MFFRSRSGSAGRAPSGAALVAALLAAPLLAACSADNGGSVPPALAPTRPNVAPTLAPSGSRATPERVIPGQRPFASPPPFTLPRVGGGTVSLSDYAGKGPVVVIFYRAYLCPFCHIQLVGLQQLHGLFQDLGAEVIAISTDTREDAEKMVNVREIEFPVLYDTDGSVSRAWGVYDILNDGCAAPSTFVIDGTGELAFWKIGLNVRDRPSAGETLAAVKQLVREGTT